MKKGIESFKASVQKDTFEGENCFNENGCDHEYTRIVPQVSPKLVEMGITQSCKEYLSVSISIATNTNG